MTAIRNEAIGYINELPEEKLVSALEYLKRLCEKEHPLQVKSKEELYSRIDAGLDDLKNCRGEPFEDTIRDLRQRIARHEV